MELSSTSWHTRCSSGLGNRDVKAAAARSTPTFRPQLFAMHVLQSSNKVRGGGHRNSKIRARRPNMIAFNCNLKMLLLLSQLKLNGQLGTADLPYSNCAARSRSLTGNRGVIPG